MTLSGPNFRWRNSYRVLKDPFEALPTWFAQYGDPFCLPTVNGDIVLTATPEHARAIFAGDPAIFEPFGTNAVGPLVGPGSVFVTSGERHRKDRRVIMPPFHGERMRQYGETIKEVALGAFEEAAQAETFDVQRVAQSISLEIILRVVFGLSADRVGAYESAITEVIDGVPPVLLFFPFLQKEVFGLGPWARFKKRFTFFDRLLDEQVDQTRRSSGGQDILSLLCAARYEDGTPMDKTDIKDQLRTLLIAGHETTALALSWAFELIHRDPEVRTALRDEIADEGDPEAIAKLPYLEAVCKETLRLYPILTEVMRVLNQPWQLGDHAVPTGHAVGVAIAALHRRPDLYPEPERFLPRRFMDEKPPANHYLPFGGGHRRCVGAAFAMYEMKQVLAAAMTAFSFELVSPTPPKAVRRNVTMAPEGGVWVRAVSSQS